MYNGEEYIRQSVESILNQSYRDFEFLIINDCSTDNSVKIIESYHDERIRIHRNESNLGQTRTLNIGLKIAAGEYVARIDADDVALPQWLELQISYAENHPDDSVVSCYVFAINEHNKIKKFYKPPSKYEDIILRSLIASPLNHVGAILKKKDILICGGYDEEYKTAADYDLWGKLLRDGFKITTNPKMLMAIREHACSLSRSERGKRELSEIMMIVDKNIKQFADMTFSEDEISLFCRANYDESNLAINDFYAAIDVTERIYRSVARALKSDAVKIERWIQNRCHTVYLKRIFSLIGLREYGSIRKLSINAIKKFGLVNVFLVLWGISWFGGIVLRLIPGIYGIMLKLQARSQLVNQQYIRTVN